MIGSLSSKKTVWGLYVEEACISAIKVSTKAKTISVEAFDTVNYSELESSPKKQADNEPKIQFKSSPKEHTNATNIKDLADLADKAIAVFLSRNQINNADKILIALPAQFVLLRFENLPAVGKKQLKNIVKYHVEKYIPIDTKEIIWDFHPINDKHVPGEKTGVGIFAIKKEDIYTFLSSLQTIKNYLTTIQIGPLSLYNFLRFNEEKNDPTMLIEVGVDNTNLMIIDNEKFWMRNIPSIDVGRGLVEEIKRSINYYKSLVKEIEIKYLTVTGNIAQQDEKKKFIAEQLGYELKEITLKREINISSILDQEKFKNNFSRLSVPFGLAAQGLSLGKININLVPEEFARKVSLSGKKKGLLFSSIAILTGVLILYFSLSVQNKRLVYQTNAGVGVLNTAIDVGNRYKSKENAYNEIIKSLDQISSIGQGRSFWVNIIPDILAKIPEEVTLISFNSKWVKTPKNAISINIRGKSFNPRLGFIEENIKKPIEGMALHHNKEDIGVPLFENVEIVPGSIQDEKDGIEFEIRWNISSETVLLYSSIKDAT